MKRLIYIATNNLHKVQEIQSAFEHLNVTFAAAQEIAPGIDWSETGATFAENARIKALALKKLTPNAVLADDSGLTVDALDGAPGIYSSRYGGVGATDGQNVQKLLIALSGVANPGRTARFVCSLCFIDEQSIDYAVEEYCEGSILQAPRGTGGFGYDPIFQLPSGQSMSELAAQEKNQVSHRGKALRQLAALGIVR